MQKKKLVRPVQLGHRVSETGARQLRGLAMALGVTPGRLIEELVERELREVGPRPPVAPAASDATIGGSTSTTEAYK